MKVLPKKIIRVDDGVEFILNEETQLYRLHLGVPHLDDPKHLHHEYSYERLMSSPQFKVADGTEDLKAMREAWLRKVKTGVYNEH